MSDSDKALINDLKLAEDARLLFRELGFALELWEALRLARTEHVTLTCEMERLQKLRKQGRSPSLGGLIIDSIDQTRKTLGPRVRNYLNHLQIGRYNRELMELAFGFLLASPEGRSRAEQWLEDPQRFLREAAIRVEGVIGKAQKYQAALRAA